jgi:hypothetical protein
MVAFALLMLTGCGGSLEASGVQQQGVMLKSLTVEAGLLTEGAADGRYPSPLVKVHAGDLADDAQGIESSLADSRVEPGARADAGRFRVAATRLAVLMSRLEASPGDRALASRLETQLDQLRASLTRSSSS